ncbi:hypothetical protein [Arthrobacter sp. NPDC093139]|uniref:hypothetical protein n=1 Tax=Arthrobacter sp. NPDC093139 TaxID=3363945 RepID=UPI0037F1F4A7
MRYELAGSRSHGTTKHARNKMPIRAMAARKTGLSMSLGHTEGAAMAKAARRSVTGSWQSATWTLGFSLL